MRHAALGALVLLLMVGARPATAFAQAAPSTSGFTASTSFGPGRFVFTDAETGTQWLVDPANGASSVVTTFVGDLPQLRVAANALGASSVWVGTTGWQQLQPTSNLAVASPMTVMLIRGQLVRPPAVDSPGGAGNASGLSAGIAAASGCPAIASPVPSVPADGSAGVTLCLAARTSAGAPLARQTLLVSTVLGVLGPGGVRSAVVDTDNAGNASIGYRGGGTPGTDSIAISNVTTPPSSIQITVTLSAVAAASPSAPAPAPTPAPAPKPAEPRAPAATGSGTFGAPPRFDATGRALAVFAGGSVDQLMAVATTAGASGAWVQDGTGAFQLLVTNGPSFLADTFRAAFPGGLAPATAVLLTR